MNSIDASPPGTTEDLMPAQPLKHSILAAGLQTLVRHRLAQQREQSNLLLKDEEPAQLPALRQRRSPPQPWLAARCALWLPSCTSTTAQRLQVASQQLARQRLLCATARRNPRHKGRGSGRRPLAKLSRGRPLRCGPRRCSGR